jgi:ABC-2 type transport system ATP-binding protein
MNRMNAIEVRSLRKTYGEHVAVAGIDLTVPHGEVFALLGPNGAGKTTTTEILEGHRGRDGGEVRVLGDDPATAGRRWRSRLGIVLQSAHDAAELTVGETVRHFARYYPRPRDPETVIEQVGLTEKAGSRVRALSGGQRRRLDVALGIIGHPELVFLDEPTTGFDPQARRQFWDLVRGLASEGTTVLLTTHYLDEAEALAQRVAVIADGRIVAEGTPTTLGGREHAKAKVAWRDANGRHEEYTDRPTELIHRITGGRVVELPELSVTRPTLTPTWP